MSARTTGDPEKAGRRLYFSTGGRIVVTETFEPALLEPARRLFPAYEVPRPGRQRPDQVDVNLRRQSGEYVVASFDSPEVFCKTSMDAIVAFEFALCRSLAASSADRVHLHASGAVVDGQAILALGKSGAGKSSLAVAMLSRGFPTLGDDTVFLGPTAKVAPFKRLLKVNPVVLRELGIDPTSTVHWDPTWHEAWCEPREGAGWAAEAPVAIIALARHDPNLSLRLSPVPAAEALNEVVHSVMVAGMPAGEGFDRLVRLVQGAEVYRLEFQSAIEAAEVLCTMTR
jgi:hypothetical protein